MAPDDLDSYLERARAESASASVPDGFTDRVMRAVHAPARSPAPFGFVSSAVASGALVGTGGLLWLGSEDIIAAAVVMAVGLLWMWLDDPFSAEIRIRLTPW
jgi:hypothetical protein